MITLKKSERDEGYKKCIEKVNQLLDDASILLQNGGSLTSIMGIYTFAIEEYRKALLIKKNNTIRDDLIVSRISNVLNSHNIKSNEALETLPEGCKEIKFSISVLSNIDGKAKTFKSKTADRSVTFNKFQTGINTDITFPDPLSDFDTRMKCFYMDWDKINCHWSSDITIAIEGLESAIVEFKKYLQNNP